MIQIHIQKKNTPYAIYFFLHVIAKASTANWTMSCSQLQGCVISYTYKILILHLLKYSKFKLYDVFFSKAYGIISMSFCTHSPHVHRKILYKKFNTCKYILL